MRYDQLFLLVALFKPKTIIEIGTNAGDRGVSICAEALHYSPVVAYTGYDVFDSENESFHQQAFNGKGFFARDRVAQRFDTLRIAHPGFNFCLIQGRTSETLHRRPMRADFVFIDGDHRAETILQDYRAIQGSRVIVFDDYYGDESPVDRVRLGCNSIVDALGRCQILPVADHFPHTGAIRMALRLRPHVYMRGRPVWLPFAR